jgi:hypothetical protein
MTHHMTSTTGDEIAQLVQTIDDNPDRLHADVTPSVLKLTKLGLPAARAVLPLLDSPKQLTRMRAFRVLGNVVMRHYGWQPQQGYAVAGQEERVRDLMQANGDYTVTAPREERQQAIAKWRAWLDHVMTNG